MVVPSEEQQTTVIRLWERITLMTRFVWWERGFLNSRTLKNQDWLSQIIKSDCKALAWRTHRRPHKAAPHQTRKRKFKNFLLWVLEKGGGGSRESGEERKKEERQKGNERGGEIEITSECLSSVLLGGQTLRVRGRLVSESQSLNQENDRTFLEQVGITQATY